MQDDPNAVVRQAQEVAAAADAPMRWWVVAVVAVRPFQGGFTVVGPHFVWCDGRSRRAVLAWGEAEVWRETGYTPEDGWVLHSYATPFTADALRTIAAQLERDA